MSGSGNFHVGGLLEVGEGNADQFGRPGVPNTAVRGSAYIEGPTMVGDPSQFAKPVFERGSLMAGQTANPDTADSQTFTGVPFYAFFTSNIDWTILWTLYTNMS